MLGLAFAAIPKFFEEPCDHHSLAPKRRRNLTRNDYSRDMLFLHSGCLTA
jgi:hypothetical protein